jgi:hypothetical protein
LVETAARLLVLLSVFPLVSSTAIIASAAAVDEPGRACSDHSDTLLAPDDPHELNLPANAIAQIVILIPPLPPGPAPPAAVAPGTARRPVALLPLYVSFAALQVADLRSTLSTLDAGGREGNPVLGGLRSPSALVGLKTGLVAGTTYAVERLRKRSPRTAVVLMIALDSAYAAVVAHNFMVAQH